MQTNRARSSSPRLVATSQRDGLVVPRQRLHLGLEQGAVVEPEVLADVAAVLEDLGRPGVLLLRDVPDLLEQRQVDVRLDVALRARVAVPVPRAAEVAALLDDADVADPGVLQTGAGEQTAEAAADDDDVDLVEQRVALERLDVRVVEVVGELPGDLDVLLVAVGAQPLVALGAVLARAGRRDRTPAPPAPPRWSSLVVPQVSGRAPLSRARSSWSANGARVTPGAARHTSSLPAPSGQDGAMATLKTEIDPADVGFDAGAARPVLDRHFQRYVDDGLLARLPHHRVAPRPAGPRLGLRPARHRGRAAGRDRHDLADLLDDQADHRGRRDGRVGAGPVRAQRPGAPVHPVVRRHPRVARRVDGAPR